MHTSPKKIMVVTGETSGDHHGAGVVTALRETQPRISVCGIGGEELEKSGMELLYHSRYLSVVGIFEVLASFSHIYRAFRAVKQRLITDPPNLLILIDYPDFNLRIAKIAHRLKIPVLYYISPQIWAWRQGRAKKIARIVDRMAVIFPFETALYEKAGLPVTFVGHPLMDKDLARASKVTVLPGLEKTAGPTIGLLPGSRKGEVDRLLPTLLQSAEIIKKEIPDANFVIPAAPGLDRKHLDRLLSRAALDPVVTENRFYETLNTCDFAIVASGTATLETAVMQVPMVIIYKVTFLTYLIGKIMIRVPFIGLANLVAGKKVVPELIQGDAVPEKIAAEATAILKNRNRCEKIKEELRSVKKALGETGAAKKVAMLARDMLE